jgi:putative ABC transport system substrate-binding protein
MRRRDFIKVIVGSMGAQPLAAGAQQGMPLIGVLNPLSPAVVARHIEALRSGLSAAGYVESQNIRLEWRFAEGSLARMRPLADELVALNPNVIVVGSSAAILTMRQATQTIPIVMSATTRDPVELGLAQSLARPGGNVTGFWLEGEEALTGKRLELLRDAFGISRIAVILNPDDPADANGFKLVPTASKLLGLQTRVIEVRRTDEFEGAFATAVRDGYQGLSISHSPLFNNSRNRMVAIARQFGLPAIYGFREFALAGGLISYAADLPDVYRRAAAVADKILKGVHPSEIPIERPTKFELVVNLRTAKAAGLKISESFLVRADEVIE